MKVQFELAKRKGISLNEERVIENNYDIIIIGGGIIGTAIANALKLLMPASFSVAVIEKDIEYTHAATTLSVGGIRQQFSLPENVQMSLFGANFLRNLKRNLSILDDEPPDIKFHPHGYLFLANESQSMNLLDDYQMQVNHGAQIDMLNAEQLNNRFPWLNTDGVLIAAHGVQDEGWFDPYNFLIALKGKAEFLGATYIHGELIDFNVRKFYKSQTVYDELNQPREACNHLIVRTADGDLKQIEYSLAVVAAGAQSGEMSRMLNLGQYEGLRSHALPVERRKRYVYTFNCLDGPGIDFPLLIDPSGVFCRRDGIGGNFLTSRSPKEDEEPDCGNLDVDYSYFDKAIYPIISKRVKAFENLKIINAWAGYYDYNTFDQNPVIGPHPYFKNIFWATGFGGTGIQMAPAVGRGIAELICEGDYKTINLERFSWLRLYKNEKLIEKMII